MNDRVPGAKPCATFHTFSVASGVSVGLRDSFGADNSQPAAGIVHRGVGLELVALLGHDLETRAVQFQEHEADADRFIAETDEAKPAKVPGTVAIWHTAKASPDARFQPTRNPGYRIYLPARSLPRRQGRPSFLSPVTGANKNKNCPAPSPLRGGLGRGSSSHVPRSRATRLRPPASQ